MKVFEVQKPSEKLSRSQCLKYQGMTISNDITRKPCEGTFEINGVIVRFRKGLLHGGFDDENIEIPAYETETGHVEFFDNGLLHRENGPAVISSWGSWEEYWIHGQLISIRSEEEIEINLI